jgi:hypothetical protein
MECHAFMDPRDLVGLFLTSLETNTNSVLRVLDNTGILGPKDGCRLCVDVDRSLLKRAGLCGRFPCAKGLHQNGRMPCSMDV